MRSSQTLAKPAYVLTLLTLLNLLNFYDRTIIAVVFEPIRLEFSLSDMQLGMLSAAFTLVYGIAGIPLGRWADAGQRPQVLAWGLGIWSLLTAATGAAWNYMSLLLVRMGVGIGEAAAGPAATSLIADMYPEQKRAKAIGIFMLGLPIGLVLAFFTVGLLVEAFGSWRAPFFIAAVPGLILALLILKVPNPQSAQAATSTSKPSLKTLLRTPTLWWMIGSGIAVNFAVYAGNGFLVALLQRVYQLPIGSAAAITGGVVGITGLIGLTFGGQLSDLAHKRHPQGRVIYGTLCLTLATVLSLAALWLGKGDVLVFALLFGLAWLCYYPYYTAVYPIIQAVVAPNSKASAMAVYFAGVYLLGAAFGPVVVGGLSDYFAQQAMLADGVSALTDSHRAIGLYDSMYLIPVMFLLTALCIAAAYRSYQRDTAKQVELALGH